MRGVKVDGNDLLEMYKVSKEEIDLKMFCAEIFNSLFLDTFFYG